MKVIIELTGDETEDVKDMLNVFRYKAALDSIQSYVRDIWKYEELSEKEYAVVDRIYGMINEEIEEV
jgi:hypothetical protein